MSDELLSSDDLERLRSFDEKRKEFAKIANEAKSIPTPKNQIVEPEKNGGYPYVKYEYMESVMSQLHPLRAVEVITDFFDPHTVTFMFTVKITDLLTKESRVGTAVHAAIIYEGGTETRKSDKVIRQLFSNAKKAALTEAMRDAMAHFGIAADMYGMIARKQPTEKQQKRFEQAISVRSDLGKEALRKKFETHFEDTVDLFIDNIIKQNDSVLAQKTSLDQQVRGAGLSDKRPDTIVFNDAKKEVIKPFEQNLKKE